tara:strand:- start:394 stop:747 length:354 start_codon:yes stop_codon:yes gene_type:complete
MKTLYLALVAATLSFSAHAEVTLASKPVQCAEPIEIINHYVQGEDLQILFLGVTTVLDKEMNTSRAPIAFFANTETGNFIVVEGGSDFMCVLSAGNSLDFNVDQNEVLGLYLDSFYN